MQVKTLKYNGNFLEVAISFIDISVECVNILTTRLGLFTDVYLWACLNNL